MLVRSEVAGVARLKSVLARHGYLGPEAVAALGQPVSDAHRRADLPLYLRRLASAAPLHVLLRLFGLLVPVDEGEARAAVAPLDLDELDEMGLTERRDGRVRARFGLAVFDGLLLAHDSFVDGVSPEVDHVLGVNPTTENLAQLTVRRRVQSALDMGCGNGVQALLLARHAEHVTGVDKNPRALAIARFNARLNGVENVEWLEGDFFAPVSGRRFDLVVSNPPYVISPESRYVFRDAGREGDSVSAEVVAGAAAHLEEGGHATVLCNWALTEGEDWSAPPRRWTKGTDCDALLLYRGSQDALEYAATWNRSRDRVAYQDALDRWTAYFGKLGIAAIGLGALVLRRRAGAQAFFEAEELPDRPQAPASEQILRMLAVQELLHGRGEASLLAGRWRAEPRHRVEQRLAPGGGRYELEEARVMLTDGLRFEGLLDAHALELLRLCDGRRTLGDAVGTLCEQGGAERSSVLAVARRFLSLGFLVPDDSTVVEGRS